MAIGDPIIEALGISWKLDTSSDFATLTYEHPVLGFLQYTGTTTWIPDNVNTLHLTSRGSLPAPEDEVYAKVLPDSVCIRPLYDANGCGCYDRVTYDTAENQCLCKDPGCDCIPERMCLECDGSTECCDGLACIGRDGVQNPSGPGYEMNCTLLGVALTGVWYCSAGQWLVDIYCNGNLVTTNPISHEGCPLKLGLTSFGGCDDCVGCVGNDCEESSDPCCEDGTIPSTLTLTDGLGLSITLTRVPGGTCVWQGSGLICGATGTWTLEPGSIGPPVSWNVRAPSGTSFAMSGTCSPMDLLFNGTACQLTVTE